MRILFFFHSYPKGKKIANTILSMEGLECFPATYFDGLSSLGMGHFKYVYTKLVDTNIFEAI